jgi:small subunit ribosomal protein S1|uniref:30S ribosomal protein S1 n=1 Tax=candidate division WOR-3 bacterium TaxID=2052148 RepID=A0A7V3VUJ3_UNCW3
MSGHSQDELSKLLEESYVTYKEGDIVKATIIKRTKNGVLVNLGLKAEGFLPYEEFSDPDEAEEGKEVYVFLEAFENREGFPVISKKKADFQLAWDKIKHIYENGEIAQATIRKKIKGGFTVELLGVDAFLPSSQIDIKPQTNPDALIGQKIGVKIVKINMMRKNIVVSRKLAVEAEQEEIRKQIFSKIKVGDVIEGVVRNITDYGAFIDIGGIDALLHISDISWSKLTHPGEAVKLNERLKVKVLSLDKASGRISVGLKQLTPHPWEAIEKKYQPGTKVKGRVVNIVDHGAFIELEKDVQGFVHVNDMSWSKDVKDPNSIVKIGDVVDAVVLSVDRDERKIYLGMKQAQPDPWSVVDEKYQIGQRVTVKVTSVKDFGIFVRLPDGIDGLIHVNDFFWDKKVKKASDYFKKGQKVDAVIRSIDRKNRKISLSIKHLQEDPFVKLMEKYPDGSEITGKVSDILPKGLKVTLEGNFEEFIPTKYLERKGKNLKDLYKIGDELELIVKKYNTKLRRIVLAEKRIGRPPAKKKEEEIVKPAADKITIGDIIGEQAKEIIKKEKE